jgi:hypothetical protein
LANSTDASNPKPLEDPVIKAIFSGIRMVYHSRGSGIPSYSLSVVLAGSLLCRCPNFQKDLKPW